MYGVRRAVGLVRDTAGEMAGELAGAEAGTEVGLTAGARLNASEALGLPVGAKQSRLPAHRCVTRMAVWTHVTWLACMQITCTKNQSLTPPRLHSERLYSYEGLSCV